MASHSDSATPAALVTGAEGFTGRYVCEALQTHGYAVHPLSHSGGGHSVNLLDRAAVADAVLQIRPSVVVHLAAISFVAHADVEEIYRVNIVGTRNLLEGLALLREHPSQVILASSANVYGNASGVVQESTPPSPQNDYAVSKLAMEYVAALWQEKLPITITRPFNYSGVGQGRQFLLPKIVSHFREGKKVIQLGNLDVARDFYDVRAVAEIYARLAGSHAHGVVNICSGSEHTLADVIAIMEEIAGYRISIEVNPDFVRANEVKRLRGDPRLLEERIGPLPAYSLRDTLEWMYRVDD